MRFMRAGTLKKLLGMPQSVRFSRATAEQLLPTCKAAIVTARLSGNDSAAADLSQAREFLKRRASGPNICHGTPLRKCDVVINRDATHCRLCAKEIRMNVKREVLTGPRRIESSIDDAVIKRSLKAAGGNLRAASRLSGFDRRTLASRVEVKTGEARTRTISLEQCAAAVERYGSQAEAARILAVSEATISGRMKKWRQQQSRSE